MTDPYEQQLLAVFESCDVEGTGRLDCDGLTQLCDQLHLEDGRHQLMDSLLPAFTFHQFRDALLSLLGATRTHLDAPPEREVLPKFVFGQKKYGRRSRPESTDQESDENEVYQYGDDTEECETFLPSSQHDIVKSKKKSCSILIDNCYSNKDTIITPTSDQSVEKEEMESPRQQGEDELRAAWRQLGVGADGYLDPTELAMVCRAVGMEKMADEVVRQVFLKLGVDSEGRISFEEFLHLFRATFKPNPPTSFQQQQQHLSSLDITSSGFVSSDNLVDMWEAGGVVNASGLLLDLGVGHASEISLMSLVGMLDEEIRSMASKSVNNSPQVNALTAALVLAQAQLKWTRSFLEQMTGERDKLHSDLAEANQRATLLAQEVDDRHARMERTSQMQIKLLEQRHAEQVKQLGVQLTMDRDQLAAATLRLEKKLALQQEEEAKLRSDFHSLQMEFEMMEKENQSLSEQLVACDVIKSKTERDGAEIQQLQQRVQELESCSVQLQTLVEQLASLQTENTSLRDRNDELTMQVENLTARPICKRQNSSSGSLEGGVSVATKRRGNSPLALPPDHSWEEDSPRLGKVRRYCSDTNLSLDSGPIEALSMQRSLRHNESGLEADIDTLDGSLNLSSSSDNRVRFNIDHEEAYIQEIERLRSYVLSLQQDNEELKKKELPAVGVGCIMQGESQVKAADDEERRVNKPSDRATLATESTEVQTSLDNTMDVNRLEKHCIELRHTLEHVQGEILKILSEKKACSEENCVLKRKIEDLSNRLPKTLNDDTHNIENNSGPLTYTLSDVPKFPPTINQFQPVFSDISKDSTNNIGLKCLPFLNHRQTNSVTPYCLFPVKDKNENSGFKFENLSQFAFQLSQSLNETAFLDSSFSDLATKTLSPCLSEEESTKNDTSLNCELLNNPISVISPKEVNTAEQDRLTKDNAELREKCAELEGSLELMRVEYEKCEDYWQGKLNEERSIFDQEQRLSDEKFAELEAKIQEYAELFSIDDKKANGRLPTIDERENLEKQVTDLEMEFEEFRKSAQQESHYKTKQIEKLQTEHQELLNKLKNKERDTHDASVQASEQHLEFRLHEPHSKMCVPVVNVTPPDAVECCCPCHTQSTKGVVRLHDRRARLQLECDMLHRRREVMLHELSQLHQRTNMLYTAMPDRRLSSDIEMFHNLSSRLRHQELRCRHLQSALKHHQRQTDKLLQNAWEQHRADLSSVQKTLHNTQEKLLHQTRLCKQQMERLSASDVLVKDLYKENAHLTALVQRLEEQNLFVDHSILASTV